jgi:copper transport protein
VSIVFDEAVHATPTSIVVYDNRGRVVNVAAPRRSVTSERLSVGLPPLSEGTFIVVWHIVSDDGHPEQGAFTFSVGRGSATTTDVGDLVARQSSGRGAGLASGIDRALVFGSCLVFVGALVFARWFWPGVLARRGVRSLLWVAGATAIVTTLLSIPLQATYTSTGGLSTMFDSSALGSVVGARFGRASFVRAAMLVALVPFVVLATGARTRSLARRAADGAVAILGLGVWATFAFAGHGNTGRLVVLGFLADVAHLSAASLWLGGVVALGVTMRDREQIDSTAQAAARFSQLAPPVIGVVVLSGAAQGWRQIGTWWALWHTSYARLLLVKALVVVAIVIVASAARDVVRDRIVPAVRSAARPGSSVAVVETDAITEVRNGIWVEVVLAVAVLSITATLVVTAPGREAQAASERVAARTLHLDAQGTRVGYVIDVQPALAGENTIIVRPRLLHRAGFLPVNVTAAIVSTRTAAPTTVGFTPLGDGRWVTTALLQSGSWRLNLIGDTDPGKDTATADVTIR